MDAALLLFVQTVSLFCVSYPDRVLLIRGRRWDAEVNLGLPFSLEVSC